MTDEIVAEAYLRLPAEMRRRLAPLICGFNATDKYAVRDIERMLDKYPFWRGVGEILCRHDDLTNMTNEETARVNHPALHDVYALCADRGFPVLLHQNSTSVSIHDEYEHLHEIEEILARFPKTVFVWAHCGVSRRVSHKNYHEMVATLLDRYPNLNVDISWVVYDDVMTLSLEPKKHWLATIHAHADRFCPGQRPLRPSSTIWGRRWPGTIFSLETCPRVKGASSPPATPNGFGSAPGSRPRGKAPK